MGYRNAYSLAISQTVMLIGIGGCTQENVSELVGRVSFEITRQGVSRIPKSGINVLVPC